MKNPCPSPIRWQSLLDGTIEDAQHSALTEHLETCAGCRELLDRLAGQGTTTLAFMDELPPAGQVPAELARVLAELKRQSPVAGAARWDIRPFLKPAIRPDALGCFGGYEIRSVIAQGGMGVVLEAHDPALDRIVAIKVLAPALATRDDYRERFVREARAAAALEHDHIVVIHAVGEEAGLPYIVMQRLAGPSLHEYLARSGPLPPDSVIRVGQQIAAALQAAHAAGLVHRDIKPANVLCEDGLARVRVTDFGLVHSVNQPVSADGRVIAGTPQFMSPEQAAAEPVTTASDLFSLGATLFALATGRPPFEGSNLGAMLERIRAGNVTPISGQRTDRPVRLWRLIRALMAREPEARPTAAQAAEQLASMARPAKRTALIWTGFFLLGAIVLFLLNRPPGRESDGVVPGPMRFTIESTGANFESLAACVMAAESGDIIEVSGEEQLEVEPLQIRGKALRIRAIPPARPELIGLDRNQPLIDTDSSLVLEGITLEHRIAEMLAPPLIRITNGTLRLAYCRLMKTSLVARMAADRVFCIEAFDSPRVELYHCEVVPFERSVGGVFARFQREINPAATHAGVLGVEHSLMTGLEAFELENETSRPVQVELARSIFINRVMVRLDDRVPANLLSVTASDCVFDVDSLLFGATPDPADFGRQFQWVGSSNRFSVRLGFVTMPRQGRPSPMPGYPVTISRWTELEQVTETGSRSAELHLWDGLLEGGAQANTIRADRVVLPPTLELENAPDLGRIGPGAPYAEWRRSAAYRDWEDRPADQE